MDFEAVSQAQFVKETSRLQPFVVKAKLNPTFFEPSAQITKTKNHLAIFL